jgi:transcriptional regulator GlxA family with amidase domain
MDVAIVAFDDFTDVDVFFMWDLLNRVRAPGWSVRILGDRPQHTSWTGLPVPTHGPLAAANAAGVVLFTSGPGARAKCRDGDWLAHFRLDPSRQLVGSMCSGALILAALGLLDGKRATTYPTVKRLLEGFGVEVVERPFVAEGNVATAAGCLAVQYLVGWVIERTLGDAARAEVLRSVQPVGEGLSFAEAERVQAVHAGGGRA